ncbi:hypothetical protein QFZ23_003655 [Arthrobacter globiformis]|uniref:hypothetical protein n=1 Tax=Arthrobacter globiformis TaxID=1665 RepID=UPI0027876F4B|nr:hypothetical protein [Arthrobacter globiformis]MDQ1059754.1 hypothetical protein [Arthrobacter globiformis]
MTALKDLLEIPSFAAALRGAASIDPEYRQLLLMSMGESLQELPEGVRLPAETSWKRIVSAFSLAYDTAEKEGRENVLKDLRQADEDFTEAEIENLSLLLEGDPAVDEQLSGIRQRDHFLPIFQGMSLALDLRVLDFEGGTKLAPLITARMHFDEPMAGVEPVVFQIPVRAVRGLIDRLEKIATQAQGIRKTLDSTSIPDWAMQGIERGESSEESAS